MKCAIEVRTMYGILLKLAYDGTEFCGWAAQKNRRSIQDTLAGAIRTLDPRGTSPRATSRTDAGVHAEAQFVAFDTALHIPPRGWVLALNQHLPDDVSVRSARAVPAGFNPRFANRGKRYHYDLLLDRVRDPLERLRAWRIGWQLDLPLLRSEAALLQGTHDFGAFRSVRDVRPSSVRTMRRIEFEEQNRGRVLRVVVEGNSFLYNMVRIMVGTLIDVGRGKLPPGTVTRALAERDRRVAGTTAPAHGLTLEWIDLLLPDGAAEPWPL